MNLINKKKSLLKFKKVVEHSANIIIENKNISLESFEHPIYRVIGIFAKSVQSKYLQYVLTTEEKNIPHFNYINLFHPNYSVIKENNIPYTIYDSVDYESKVSVDFNKEIVISFPWSIERFSSALKNLNRDNWEYDPLNHMAYYFEPFKIGVVYNGMHSSTIGILLNKGTIPAKVIDMSSLFEWIRTDGLYYYNLKTGKRLSKVASFEESVIFEIGRMIHINK